MKNYFLFTTVLPVLVMILATLFSIVPCATASDIMSAETPRDLMTSLPPSYMLVDLEQLSKYTLRGMVTEIEHKMDVDKISIKVENERYVQHENETIKFNVQYYTNLDPYSKSVHANMTYQIGENITVFLTGKEPESNPANSYSGFVANQDVFSAGIAYDVTSTKQSPPLQQHESGTLSRSVNCNDGLELLIKATNGQPICVTPSTRATLVERDWVTQ